MLRLTRWSGFAPLHCGTQTSLRHGQQATRHASVVRMPREHITSSPVAMARVGLARGAQATLAAAMAVLLSLAVAPRPSAAYNYGGWWFAATSGCAYVARGMVLWLPGRHAKRATPWLARCCSLVGAVRFALECVTELCGGLTALVPGEHVLVLLVHASAPTQSRARSRVRRQRVPGCTWERSTAHLRAARPCTWAILAPTMHRTWCCASWYTQPLQRSSSACAIVRPVP